MLIYTDAVVPQDGRGKAIGAVQSRNDAVWRCRWTGFRPSSWEMPARLGLALAMALHHRGDSDTLPRRRGLALHARKPAGRAMAE